jgi:hypothetical protein
MQCTVSVSLITLESDCRLTDFNMMKTLGAPAFPQANPFSSNKNNNLPKVAKIILTH